MTGSRTNYKKHEFQHQLAIAQEKVEKLKNTSVLDQAKQLELQDKLKKVSRNVLLFDDSRLYLYGPIENDFKEINEEIKKGERILLRKSLEATTIQQKRSSENGRNDDISIADFETLATRDSTPVELESKHANSTSFSLLSFFRCHRGKNEKQQGAAKKPTNYNTFAIDESQRQNQQAKSPSLQSTFSSGLAFLSSLFCGCFGRRKSKGYEPIPTDTPSSFQMRRK